MEKDISEMTQAEWCASLKERTPEGTEERKCFFDAADLYALNQELKSQGPESSKYRAKAKRLLDKGLELRNIRINNQNNQGK